MRFGRAALRVALRAGQLPRPRATPRARRPRHPRQGAAGLGGPAAGRGAAAPAAADGRSTRSRGCAAATSRSAPWVRLDAGRRASRSCWPALFARAAGAVGLISAAPPAPIPAAALELGGGAIVGARRDRAGLRARLAGRAARAAARHGAARARAREPDAPGAVVAVGLTIVVIACAALWVGNPYAAALLVPAAHLWLLVADAGPAAAALGGAGARRASALAAAARSSVRRRRAARSGSTSRTASGSGRCWSPAATSRPARGCCGACCWGCAVAARAGGGPRAAGRRTSEPDEITVRGPVTYAGPGLAGRDAARPCGSHGAPRPSRPSAAAGCCAGCPPC